MKSEVSYADTMVTQESNNMDAPVKVTTTVENTGSYAVNEAVQVYVKDVEASVITPIWQLRKVESVHLMPGEKKTVEMILNPRDFALITEEGTCIVEPGEFKISVGGQQPDAVSEQLTGKKTSIFSIEKCGEVLPVEY